MTGISRRRWGAASWLRVGAAVLAIACGGHAGPKNGIDPSAPRVVPLASVIVLETAGPPPSDTTVTFTAGQPRVIVLRHGPPENVVFAELMFPPSAFRADSGRCSWVPAFAGTTSTVTAERPATPAPSPSPR